MRIIAAIFLTVLVLNLWNQAADLLAKSRDAKDKDKDKEKEKTGGDSGTSAELKEMRRLMQQMASHMNLPAAPAPQASTLPAPPVRPSIASAVKQHLMALVPTPAAPVPRAERIEPSLGSPRAVVSDVARPTEASPILEEPPMSRALPD